MRKSLVSLAVAVTALVFAAVALASFTQYSIIKLTANKAGKPTGFTSNVYSKSSGKPRAAKQLVVTFPTGTTFNLALIKQPCKLTDAQIKSGKPCPSGSAVGSGTASSAVYSGTTLLGNASAVVKAYVAGSKTMVIVVKATFMGVTQTVPIRETVSGNKLTIPVPAPGSTAKGFDVILTSLKLTVPAKSIGGKPLSVAGKCPATGANKHKFVVSSHFTYWSGGPVTITSSSPCS